MSPLDFFYYYYFNGPAAVETGAAAAASYLSDSDELLSIFGLIVNASRLSWSQDHYSESDISVHCRGQSQTHSDFASLVHCYEKVWQTLCRNVLEIICLFHIRC